MKAIKRIFATILCFCFLMGSVSMTAFAAEATGSITVENQSGTNASVAGKTLNLFKIFNATSNGENISYQWIETEEGTNLYESFFFGEEGVISEETGTIHDVVAYINGLKDDSFAFSQMAAKLHTYIHENGIDPDQTSGTIASNATYYKFSNLSLGYYLIYDATDLPEDSAAVRSAAMLSHSGENKVIKLKADRPHIEKTVDDSKTDTPDWKNGTTASVGDVVTFRIVTMIPDYDLYGDNYTFEIMDKMADELALMEDSIKVTLTKPSATEEESNFSYDILTASNSTDLEEGVDFKVQFNHITELPKDTVVEIIYDAKVTKDAGFKNLNTAVLTYSNDPHKTDSVGSVESTATVLLWQFTLTKYMEDAGGTPSYIRLSGAEFEIYKKDDLDHPLKFSTSEVEKDGLTYLKYTFDPEAGTITTLQTLDSGDDGKTDVGYTDGGFLGQILVFGLGEGTYVIRETKAPDGYQIAKGDFEFTVKDVIGITGAVSNATISEATRTEAPGKFTRVSIDEKTQKYYVGITNAPGSALPETGGIGTTLFTVLGIVLMTGALVFFASRKRSNLAY